MQTTTYFDRPHEVYHGKPRHDKKQRDGSKGKVEKDGNHRPDGHKETDSHQSTSIGSHDEAHGASNSTLYTHVTDVLKRMYRDEGAKCAKGLEDQGLVLKAVGLQYKELDDDHVVLTKEKGSAKGHHRNLEEAVYHVIENKKGNLGPKGPFEQCILQDLMAENEYWKRAGLGLSEEDALFIQKSMENLVRKDNSIRRIRFFGIFQALKRDYFVIEGNSLKDYKEKLPEDYERRGQGANSYTYWVSNKLLGDWIELPLISPQQLNASRMLKVALVGDLGRQIKGTLPPFPGTEAHYLKCQIVRMAFNTQIAPVDVFKIAESTGKAEEEKPDRIEINNEYVFPNYDELIAVSSWVHVNPAILKGGRASHFASKTLSEDARAELLGKLEEKDPTTERLKPITEDKPLYDGTESCWRVRKYGDNQIFNETDDDGVKPRFYGVFVIENDYWPGARTILIPSLQTWSFVYFGVGMKNRQLFIPKEPGEILKEPEDLETESEPNPAEPPQEELESDSDAPIDDEP